MDIGKSLTIEHRTGDEATPPDAGDGASIIVHHDGYMQLAIYWSEDDGDRHTIHIGEAAPRLLVAIATALAQLAKVSGTGREATAVIRIRPHDAGVASTRH